jgi:uncharacterized protein YhaN
VEHSEKTVKRLREELTAEGEVPREDIARLDEIEVRLRYLDAKKGDFGPSAGDVEPPKAPSPFLFLAGLVATIGCLTAVFLAGKVFLIGVAVGAAWAGFSGLSFLRRYREAIQKEWEYKNSYGKKDEVVEEFEKAQRTINELLVKYRVSSIAALREKYEAGRDRARQIKEETLRYENWLSGRTRPELEEELKTVTKRLTELREKPLEVYEPVPPEELEILTEKLTALEEERHHLQTARNAIARRIEQSEDGVELKVALEERLEEETRRIAELEKKRLVFLKTYELWEKARKKIMTGAADVLDEEVSRQLSDLTGGRYTKARFDKENFGFEVFSEEKQAFVNPHKELSAGVRDQLYLAARLALLKFIFPEQKPLLILDEPFANFDPQRRQKACEMLVKLASEYQILLLTSQDYFDHLAEAKIQL